MKSSILDFQKAKPFSHILLPHFLSGDDCKKFMAVLKKERFSLKESDLFTLWQSYELKDNPRFSSLVRTFTSPEWKEKIMEMTGIRISSSLDLFASLYKKTNHLLPHDDQLEGRKIAYILFLNTLAKKQGGALQLFQENKVVKKIYPQAGTLVLFEVSSRSVHSIEEIYSGKRWALTGWFHG